MKSILFSGVFAFVALSVAGAPTYSEGEQPRYVNKQQIQQIEEFLRERRAPLPYVAPCVTGSAIQYPVSSVPVFSTPSYQGYAAVPQYGYVAPHYRSVDEQQESELLGFSDMDQVMQGHVPMARLGGYGSAGVAAVSPALSSALSAVGGRVLNQATSGTALGVFPNANVGRCSVPLLFSCSPNIVPGHLAESQYHVAPAYTAAAAAATTADSYRLVDEPVQHEAHDKHEELLASEHVNHEPSHATHQ